MNVSFAWFPRSAAWLGATCCLLAIVGFSVALDGYRHGLHPLGLLGASGIPHALGFNLLGLVLPGVLLAMAAVAVRGRLPEQAGRSAGVGVWLLALSALALAAQGVWPLELRELEGPQGQAHTTAWTLWWVAFVPGALLLAIGVARAPRWRLLAMLLMVCAGAVLLAAVPPSTVPGPIAQRIGLVAWLLAYVAASSARSNESA